MSPHRTSHSLGADVQTSALAAEIEEARGRTFPFLVWSGSLPPAEDKVEAVNLLVRKRWWLFTGEVFNPAGDLEPMDEAWAVELLTWLIGHGMAYEVELMPHARAAELAAKFVALLPHERYWFTNGDPDPGYPTHPRPNPSTPLTAHTFDTGVVAVGSDRAWIAWFTDED